MKRFWVSAKIQVMIADAIFSSVAIVLAWYLQPELLDDILKILGLWQGVCGAVILGIAGEDMAQKGAIQTKRYIEEQHPAEE
jgi:hypothetical protein